MASLSSKRSVLITGCSEGGIGHALVVEFCRRGLHVFATTRNIKKMATLASLPNVTLLALDVTSASSITAAVEAVKARTSGKLDYLVNNSGVQYVMPILDVDIKMAKQMYEVNIWGVLAVTQAFAPMVIEAKGCVINMASIAGCLYPPWMGLYSASKSALSTISEVLRLELAPLSVKVITVITGAVATNLHANAPEHHLPTSSLYSAASEEIASRATNSDVKGHSKPKDFAMSVVDDVLGGKSGKVFRGSMASQVRFASTNLPASVMDMLIVKGTGLDKVAAVP